MILVFGLACPGGAYSADSTPPANADQSEDIEELNLIEEVQPSAGFDSPNQPLVDRAIDQLTARPIRAGALQFAIDHRTRQSVFAGDEELWRDYLGLDAGGLKIGLTFRFGILDDLDLGLMRLNGTAEAFDSYQFDGRYRFLKQADHGLDLAVRGGFTAFVHPGDIYAIGYLAQLLLDKTFSDRLLVGVGLLFHSDSSNDVKSTADTNWSLAVGASLELRILDWLAWDLEVAANVAGFGSAWPCVATSLKVLTHRHTFSLVVTNNQYIGADGLVANTWRGFDDLIIGFQITREFNLW
jgi:hypothetical protein